MLLKVTIKRCVVLVLEIYSVFNYNLVFNKYLNNKVKTHSFYSKNISVRPTVLLYLAGDEELGEGGVGELEGGRYLVVFLGDSRHDQFEVVHDHVGVLVLGREDYKVGTPVHDELFELVQVLDFLLFALGLEAIRHGVVSGLLFGLKEKNLHHQKTGF